MRHRYIFCGVVWEDPRLSSYRLIRGLTYSGGHFIRVNIPDDVEFYNSGSGWSGTYDDRSILDLGCDCYILYKGHLDLQHIQRHILQGIKGGIA